MVQWPYTIGIGRGGGQTEATVVGQNEMYRRENLIGPFLVHKLLGPRPPLPPLPPFSRFPGGGGGGSEAGGRWRAAGEAGAVAVLAVAKRLEGEGGAGRSGWAEPTVCWGPGGYSTPFERRPA